MRSTANTGHFAKAPTTDIQRSSFDLSHGVKTTIDVDYLYPILVEEALPASTFNINMDAFARLSTPLRPLMDNLFLEVSYFAIPYRLVWDNTEKFFGEQANPGDSTDFLIPQMISPSPGGYPNMSVHDFMGLPTQIPNMTHSVLWHRAMNLVWNNWFRDQNLQDSVIVNTDDGPDLPADYTLLKRGKKHDYMTSCLPDAQKGPPVTLPLATEAPVNPVILDVRTGAAAGANISITSDVTGLRLMDSAAAQVDVSGTAGTAGTRMYTDLSGLTVDLSQATEVTVELLRYGAAIQRLYEKDMRGGTRYPEIMLSHFKVVSPDARLQRPEYLGGGRSHINFTPVPSTIPQAVGVDPQGTLAAYATASTAGVGFVKSFVEHTLILGFVNIRADLTYQQGLHRKWSRQTRWDHFWPELQYLGEQPVLNKEIFAQGADVLNPELEPIDDDAFGFQERWAEYRFHNSMITGKFRSNDSQSLDLYHVAEDYANLPVLGPQFIESTTPIDRILATPEEPNMILDTFINFKAALPLPTYSIPGMGGRF